MSDLKLGETLRVVAVAMQQPDQAELRHGEADAGAIDAVADRRDHDRQEQQVEELEAALGAGSPTMIHSDAAISAT